MQSTAILTGRAKLLMSRYSEARHIDWRPVAYDGLEDAAHPSELPGADR